jgi:hypothetical protein
MLEGVVEEEEGTIGLIEVTTQLSLLAVVVGSRQKGKRGVFQMRCHAIFRTRDSHH